LDMEDALHPLVGELAEGKMKQQVCFGGVVCVCVCERERERERASECVSE
jgi:hypothetical protein